VTTRIETAELGLPAIDALDVDAWRLLAKTGKDVKVEQVPVNALGGTAALQMTP